MAENKKKKLWTDSFVPNKEAELKQTQRTAEQKKSAAANVQKWTQKSGGTDNLIKKYGSSRGNIQRMQAEQKWYSGNQPTIRETVAQMYRIAGDTPEEFQKLEEMFNQEISTPGSFVYNPYAQATNTKAIEALTELGYDLSGGVTQKWLDDHRWLAQYGRQTTTSYGPSAPTKKSTDLQDASYWYNVLLEDEEATVNAETEYKTLADNVKYLVDRGYSDDAILKKIKGEDFGSSYKMLAKMDEERSMGSAVRLNRSVNYNGDDTIYGMIWAARNGGGSGDYFIDSVSYALGSGNKYKPDPTSEAAHDPSNYEDYHPYYGGSTLHEINMRTGQTSYTPEWLEANRSMLSGTEQEKRDWQDVYDALENTDAALAELDSLNEWAQKKLEAGKDADWIINTFNSMYADGDYKTLSKMERERERGGAMALTAEVDFTKPRFEQWVRDQVAERDAANAEAEAEAKAKAEAEAAKVQAEREAKAEAAIAGGSAFMSGGMGSDGPVYVGEGVQPAEPAEPEVAPEPTRPPYEKDTAYKSVFGVVEEQPREGMAGGEFVPQASGNDIGELVLLGANGSGKMDPNSEDGQAYIAMLDGGEWNDSVYAWAMRNSSNRAGLADELEQGILDIRSGKPMDQVTGLARSWWNAHAHLVDYTAKGIDYSRNIGVVDDSLDAAQYYGAELDEVLRMNAEAANIGAITPQQYVENLIEIAGVTDMVDGIAVRDKLNKDDAAQIVLEDVPGQMETIESIYAGCEEAIEYNREAQAAAEEMALNMSIDAVKAYHAGTASAEQTVFMNNAMAMDVSAVAKKDAGYQDAMAYLDETLSLDGLRGRGINFSTGSAEADMAMDPEMLYATGAQAYTQGVKKIAETKLQQDLKLATVCGMTLAEYYEAFPQQSRTVEQVLAEAETEYTAAWLNDFGGTIKGMLEMNEAEEEAKEGLGLRESVFGMPAQKFDAMTAASFWKTIDFLFYKGLSGDEAMGAMYRSFGGNREAATAAVTEYAQSLPAEHEQRKELETFLGSGADIFSLGKTIGQLKTEAGVTNAEADLQAINRVVSEYGTDLEKTIVDISSSSMNSITQMATTALGVSGGLPNWLASVISAIPEGGSTGYDLQEQGAHRGAALLAAFGNTLWTGLTESFMNTEYLSLGGNPIVQRAKKALSQSAIKDMLSGKPGAAAKALNFMLDAVANAPAEGGQEFIQSLGGSFIENVALNLSGVREGFILDAGDISDAGREFLMGMVTSLPLSGIGAGIESFTNVTPTMIDPKGNLLSMAEAQLLPEYDGVLTNAAINNEITKEAVYEAAADLEAIASSSEQAAVEQANAEVQAAMIEASEAEQEAAQMEAEASAKRQALDEVNQQMLESDTFDQDMQKRMTEIATSIVEADTALSDAQKKAEDSRAKVQAAQQKAADAETAVQALYDQVMEAAKQRVAQRVLDRMNSGVSEEAQAANQTYLDLCAKLTEAKSALRSAKADLDIYAKGSARSESARAEYGRKLIEVDELTAQVAEAKAAVDEAFAGMVASQADEMIEESVSAAEAAAQEAEAASAAEPGSVRLQLAAALARAEANAEAAARNLEGVRRQVSEQITSADRDVRSKAVQDYQTAVQEAQGAQDAAAEARSTYESEFSAQGQLQKAIDNLQQYSNEDILLEDSANHEAAVEAEAEVRDALDNVLAENAKKELDAARDALDSSNPESVIAFQEARDRYAEVMKQKAPQADAGVKPIDARSYEDMRDRSVQPFFNTRREEYSPYILAAAETILSDVGSSTPGKRIFIWDKQGGLEVTGQRRMTSDLIASYKDRFKWTWDDTKDYLNKFINAVKTGANIPNTPNMKRIEMMVDEALSNGYTAITGQTIQPAYDYLRLKAGDNTLVFEGEDSTDGISAFDAYGVGSPITPRLRKEVADAMRANPDSAVQTASGRYLLEMGNKLVYTDENSDNPTISEVIVNKCAGLDLDMDKAFKEVLIEADGTETFNETWEGCAECFRDVFGVRDPISRTVAEVHTAAEGDPRGTIGRSSGENGLGNQPKVSFKREVLRRDGGWTDHGGAAKTGETTVADRNPIEILSDLTRSIRVGYNPGGSMSAGNRRLPRDVLGFYNHLARSITTRTSEEGDMALGLHEFGHAVQDRLNGLHATQTMIDALPQDVRDAYDPRELDGEAVAEFVVAYMYNRDQAVAMAGDAFVQDFEDRMYGDRSLYDAVMAARNQIELWNNADTGSKIGSMKKNGNDPRRGEVGNWLQRTWRKVETAVFDLTAPADLVSRGFRRKALYSAHASRRADVALTRFLIDPNGRNIGRSLAERFYDAGVGEGDQEAVSRYALARHALDRLAQNKPVFDEHEISEQELRDYVAGIEANHPNIVAGADALVGFWNDFMDAWWVQTGMIDQDAIDRMRQMYPHYVPTFRVVGENFSQFGGESARFRVREAVEGGSSLEVIDPLISIVKMTQQMVSTVTHNQMMQAFHEEMQRGGLGEIAERVPQNMVLRETDTTALQQTLDAINASGTVDPALMGDAYAEMLNLQERWVGTGQNYGDNVVSGTDEYGNRFFYRIKDKGLYDLLSGANNGPVNVIPRVVGNFTRTFTALTTGSNPLFAIKNMQRDIQASVNTGTHSLTYADGMIRWLAAFREVLSGSQTYREWQAMGGGEHTRFNTELDSNDAGSVARELGRELMRGRRRGNGDFTTRSTALERISNVLTWEQLNNAIENTSRYVEYRYGRHDRSTAEGRERAFMASQDVTTNFGTHGAMGFVRAASRCVPFMNATLQGLNKDINIVKDLLSGDAVRSRQAAPKAAKTVMNMALTAAMQYALLKVFGDNEDEEEYALLNQEMRTGNLIIPLPKAVREAMGDAIGFDKPFVRIPMAQGVMAQGLYAVALDAVSNMTDYSPLEVDLWQAAKSIVTDQIPDGSVFQAISDAKNNRTWYGGEIESEYMRRYSVTNRYAADTPQSIIALGDKLGVSPAKLDYLLNQYTGFAGKIIMPLISRDRLNLDERWTLEGAGKNLAYSILSNYTIDPVSSNSLSGNYSSAKDVIAEIIADGSADKPIGNIARTADGYDAYRAAKYLNEEFADLDKEIAAHWVDYNEIKNSTTLSDGEKVNQMRRIRRDYIIPLQQEALALYEEYKMEYIDADDLAMETVRWLMGEHPTAN